MNSVIEIDLDNRLEYLNEFDDNRIADRLCQYILDSYVDFKKVVELRVKFNYVVKQNEKENINNIFKNSFERYLKQIDREFRWLNLRDVILIVLGIVFLGIYWYFDKYNIFIFAEIFMIIGWVAFWVVAESFLFQRRNLIINRKKYLKLLNAKISIME